MLKLEQYTDNIYHKINMENKYNKESERKTIDVSKEDCIKKDSTPKKLENLLMLLNDKNQEQIYILNAVEDRLSDLEISLRPLLGVTVYEKLKVPIKDVKPDSELPVIIKGMLEGIDCVDSQLYKLNDIINYIQHLTNQIEKTI